MQGRWTAGGMRFRSGRDEEVGGVGKLGGLGETVKAEAEPPHSK